MSWKYTARHNRVATKCNGNAIGGYVSPAPTHPVKSKYYLTYDITGLLKTGKNTLCAIAHYMGGDGQNYVNGFRRRKSFYGKWRYIRKVGEDF